MIIATKLHDKATLQSDAPRAENKAVNELFRDQWARTWDSLTAEEPLLSPTKLDIQREFYAGLEGDDYASYKFNANLKIANQLRIKAGKKVTPKHWLSPNQYRALRERSGENCEICSVEFKGVGTNRFHIDHDHDTGRIRGVLCPLCNRALERVDRDPLWGKRAFLYLAKHGKFDAADDRL